MENSSMLLRMYNEFTGQELDINNIEDKIIIQKIVFLLGEMGLKIGNYKFALHKFGPFSQSLHNDIALIKESDSPFKGTFSEPVMEAIAFLKQLIKKQEETKYSLREWVEAIATFIFLKQYMYPLYNWDNINLIVMDIKEYLRDEQSNKKAIYCCKEFFKYRT